MTVNPAGQAPRPVNAPHLAEGAGFVHLGFRGCIAPPLLR